MPTYIGYVHDVNMQPLPNPKNESLDKFLTHPATGGEASTHHPTNFAPGPGERFDRLGCHHKSSIPSWRIFGYAPRSIFHSSPTFPTRGRAFLLLPASENTLDRKQSIVRYLAFSPIKYTWNCGVRPCLGG
ncbi:hypothetical protein H112_01412 [Trichophyton rubrum D6]|uniref:Uncharacterized protein n=2 Tax=Trichophyton TaxID=5550 RepID=A0A022WDM3_TRIRU|nr:hypothetical protein H100_01407 [Trichophyton rubrum MR850]EZF45521.1 hypothetical protein H102_01402 [Trichophyton rubrum CBS 100081]EZF56168.1 hypothetical protein H103_01412 [Trichophyton rubrum CBS 288.86]EZF66707.1 hypothetical protein H104_01392 [Trichophyton rubrum CBS 289.86]EZF77412.1 hypothetical protein H105_01422 [Trichophyton soudanense CBS 452.61]EZF87997.1 hypothetical protein H110_01411 [Trichophyton rubrum MR1448]EZF98857.1 hypothetical protein H113_01417 [Trichophyton rub